MKRTMIGTACLLAVALAALNSDVANAARPANLVTNGGFENGLIGWTPAPEHELVKESRASHSGSACLAGEVTGDRQAYKLLQNVPVKKGNLYRFEVWARSDKRTKLVLFITKPGSRERVSIGQWQNVPAKWTKYQIPIEVAQSGNLGLELIAPSSYAAPPGKIWIDDVALFETEMPKVASISMGEGYNDEPSMAALDDGTALIAWNSFQDGNDSLQATHVRPEGDGARVLNSWTVDAAKGMYLLRPRVVSNGKQAAIVYAAEKNRQWDIYVAMLSGTGPSKPVAITDDAKVDVRPSAAWNGDTLQIVWESNPGGERKIETANWKGGTVSDRQTLSEPGINSYEPAIAVLRSGVTYVAWQSFKNANYDLFYRTRSASGTWATPVRATEAPNIDRHVVLTADGDKLWMIYENAYTPGYHIGKTDMRGLSVVQLTEKGFVGPDLTASECPLTEHCEAPAATVDSAGRLWIAYRKPRVPRGGWDTLLACLDRGRWLEPMNLTSEKGYDRAPGIVCLGDRVLVAMQTDDSATKYKSIEESRLSTSDIFLASIKKPIVSHEPSIDLIPRVESDLPFEAAEIRLQRGDETPTPSIDYEGKKLNLYFGDLHEHTEVSRCNQAGDQSIDESYQHMRDLARYDFACVTDHGYNINPYLWNYTAKLARVNDDPNRFLTFLGEEWTSSFEEYSEEHPYGFYGHRNLVLADSYFPRWWNAQNYQTPAELWEDLRKMNADFINIPHQIADTGNVPTDWNYTDEEAQPVAEIFQVRGSYEYLGAPRMPDRAVPEPGYFLQDAWARGVVIGVIGSPDHGGGYGKACVYAPELSREAVLQAIRERHCYGSSGAKILLDVRINDHLMGEKVKEEAGDQVEVRIDVSCPMDIARVDVCRNNQFIHSMTPGGKKASTLFVDRAPLPGRSYYYVRVIQVDEEIAWTSPVWFGAE